ncbi:MAG: molybdopterin-dependent oxidoreductase [Planctomycetota bacterium]|jgi:DMSO/TMAO reductase YedYZ molybdopterin-dependent catalytic subunit
MPLTRRDFVGRSLRLGAGALFASTLDRAVLASLIRLDDDPALEGGRRLGLVRFGGGSRRPLDVPYGSGLNGRLRHDLTKLTEKTLITPNEHFYIRTRCPQLISYESPWTIEVDGHVDRPGRLAVESIARSARPMGVHLLECSGNGGEFGLISAARWDGVPLREVLASFAPTARGTRSLVRGFDRHTGVGRNSREPGASWIFSLADLERTGAFLATTMNDEPLSRDHGFPVRLVVPGWYGCTCIKWVDRITLVDDEAPSTRHMREFASRTHQRGEPRLARRFRPAEIDLTAMPVRIEKWRVDEGIVYRVVGVQWGGRRDSDALRIRFGDDQDFVAVHRVAERESTSTWGLWTHIWRPARPGRYAIRLRVDDPDIRTRRLDRGFYRRVVDIDEAAGAQADS